MLDNSNVVDRHRCHKTAKFVVFVNEDHSKIPTFNLLTKLQKDHISHMLVLILALIIQCNFELSISLTFCHTAI